MFKKFNKENQTAARLIVTLLIPIVILKLALSFLPFPPLVEDVLFISALTWALYVLVKFLRK